MMKKASPGKVSKAPSVALPHAFSTELPPSQQLNKAAVADRHGACTELMLSSDGAGLASDIAAPLLPQIIALPPRGHGLHPPPKPVVEVPKIVREYPLPGSRETHEMALVSDTMLVVSQQTNGVLIKVQLCAVTGRPLACASFFPGTFWAGLHGLAASQVHVGHVWASLQFESLLIRINVGADLASLPEVEQCIELPPSVKGPHCVYEYGENLWTSCKDSGHVVRVKQTDSSDCSVYPCGRRPIFIAIHPLSDDVYASLDVSSKIWRLVPSTGFTTEIDISPNKGSTPVGLVHGPDGNIWFTLVGDGAGGNGTFARILASGEIQWFSLTTSVGLNAGLVHLAFDWDFPLPRRHVASSLHAGPVSTNGQQSTTNSSCVQLWLLGTSMVAEEGKSTDAVFTVIIDTKVGRIINQHSITLPTQRCGAHRILPHRMGLFVTQMHMSSLAHISGAAVLKPTAVTGEKTDFYMDFGLGQSLPRFKFSET